MSKIKEIGNEYERRHERSHRVEKEQEKVN